MKKKPLALAIQFVAAFVGATVFSRPLSVRSAFDEINIGMTEDEVQQIMVVASGRYTNSPDARTVAAITQEPFAKAGAILSGSHALKGWLTEEGAILLTFEKGVVSDKSFLRVMGLEDQTLARSIRYRLWWIFR